MKTISLTTLEFAEFIEEKGLLAFGEPYVKHDVIDGCENLSFYLTYPTHGVHSILITTNFVNNSSTMRKTVFNDYYEKDELEQGTNVILLSDFISENKTRKIYVPNELGISRAAGFVGNESQKKKLTWFLARKILLQDMQKNRLSLYEQEMRLSSIIRSTPDAIGKPEQVAYLARFDILSEEDIKEYINLPLEWLYRSLKPCESFNTITMPWTDAEKNSSIYRRTIFL